MLNISLIIHVLITIHGLFKAAMAGMTLGQTKVRTLIVLATLYVYSPSAIISCYADMILIIEAYHSRDYPMDHIIGTAILVIMIAVGVHVLPAWALTVIFNYGLIARMAYKFVCAF